MVLDIMMEFVVQVRVHVCVHISVVCVVLMYHKINEKLNLGIYVHVVYYTFGLSGLVQFFHSLFLSQERKLTCSQQSSFIAQFVQHCAGIAKVMGLNPVFQVHRVDALIVQQVSKSFLQFISNKQFTNVHFFQ